MFRLLREDVLDGLRRGRRSPRFAWLAVGTLALGIGVATAVCTMAHTPENCAPSRCDRAAD